MRNTLLIINLLFTFSGFSQTTYEIKDFEKSEIPKVFSTEWRILNSSNKCFSIIANNDNIQVTKRTYSPILEYLLPEGKLIAIDKGEWGGGLYYKPNDTINKSFSVNGVERKLKDTKWFPDSSLNKLTKSTLSIMGGNIMSVFSFNGSLYFMDALAHMGTNKGVLYKIEQQNDSFLISKVIDFDNAPRVVYPIDDTIFVATFDRFYTINKEMEKTLIFKDLFWYGLGPFSITPIGNTYVYLGLAGGFAKINLLKKDLELYKYKYIKE
ncbi:hypothetical protein [Flavobacterium sp. WC2509]|uniref:hypothetical protein n=1 Tax=Flavobacterium sp. WC2509 TaxID=3461406 RepID=UPI0040441929